MKELETLVKAGRRPEDSVCDNGTTAADDVVCLYVI
jgi:hypothetical protein